jgi:hypothetical protein
VIWDQAIPLLTNVLQVIASGLAVTAGVIGIVRHRQRHRDSGSTDTKV